MSERRERQLAKQQARRDRRFFLATALIGVFILGLICGGRLVNASKPVKHSYKYYKEVKVDLGETLWDIAEDYAAAGYASASDYISEIREINSICDEKILYGQQLLIPYYSSDWK